MQDNMVKDALKFVLPALGLALACALAGWRLPAAAFLAAAVLVGYFFRNPRRTIPQGDKLILSPADGRVMHAGAATGAEGQGQQLVSIFMGLLDVHVNRSPVEGILESLEYRRGRYRAAFRNEASGVNAQNILTIRGRKSKLVVKQIAGVLARRAVCWKSPGEALQRGEVIGLIRFGSRVDVLVPENVKLCVREGQRVRGGVSVLGEYP